VPDTAVASAADAAMNAVVADAVAGGAQLVRVEAPPGAGKTRLIKRMVAAALESGESMMVAVQTNAQLIDLAQGLADELTVGEVGVWPSGAAKDEYGKELARIGSSRRVRVLQKTKEVADPLVVVAVAAKWAHHASVRRANQRIDRRFQLGVVDEAYQMPAATLFRFGRLMERLALVGDPGQLDPFTEVDTARWDGLPASAATPGPRAVDALSDVEAVVHRLPASLRLDARAARVVQRCFYPDLAFRAVSVEDDRALTLERGEVAGATDEVLDLAAEHGWALLELPRRLGPRDDDEVAGALAGLAERLLSRNARVRATWPETLRKGAPLRPESIAIATSHRDQRDRVLEALSDEARGVVVDTANRLQGREFDVLLAWHPLSGRLEASEFHLDTGRLCVMASRHRQACVFVCRAGIGDALEDHQPSGHRPKGSRIDREHDGWVAHQRFFDALSRHRVRSA